MFQEKFAIYCWCFGDSSYSVTWDIDYKLVSEVSLDLRH